MSTAIYGYNAFVERGTELPPAHIYMSGLDSGDARIKVLEAVETSHQRWRRRFLDRKLKPLEVYYVDLRFKFEDYMGWVVNLDNAYDVEQLWKDTESMRGMEDEHDCNARNNQILIHLAAAHVADLVLKIRRGDIRSTRIMFGGSYEGLSTVTRCFGEELPPINPNSFEDGLLDTEPVLLEIHPVDEDDDEDDDEDEPFDDDDDLIEV